MAVNNQDENFWLGQEGKVVMFSTILAGWPEFNPHPGHVVASMDRPKLDDYYLR